MISTCLQLLSLPSFQKIRLIGGRNGLYRPISWPYVTLTPSISEWLHGGELVFVTCSNYQADENDMILFLKDALEMNLSGVVLLQGGDSLLSITPAMIDYADEHQFPLFVMEWDMPIVDVVQEISEMILSQKKQFDTKQRFFFEMLFSADSKDKYDRLTRLYGLPKYQLAEVAVLHPPAAIETPDLLGKLSYYLQSYPEGEDGILIAEKHISDVVCFILADSAAAVSAFEKRLIEFLNRYASRCYPEQTLWLTFSNTASADGSAFGLFEQARKALAVLLSVTQNQTVLHWADVGYRGLLFDLAPEARRSFVRSQLQPLVRAQGSMDLVDTLRCYLDHNGNILHTAQAMYLHKNTLSYRLNRIRELLGKDLNATDIRTNLRMALDIALLFPEEDYFS